MCRSIFCQTQRHIGNAHAPEPPPTRSHAYTRAHTTHLVALRRGAAGEVVERLGGGGAGVHGRVGVGEAGRQHVDGARGAQAGARALGVARDVAHGARAVAPALGVTGGVAHCACVRVRVRVRASARASCACVTCRSVRC